MYEVVGIQPYSKDKADGSKVNATILHLAQSRDGCQGVAVENVYCNHQYVSVPALQLKDKVEVRYNRSGYVSAIEKV